MLKAVSQIVLPPSDANSKFGSSPVLLTDSYNQGFCDPLLGFNLPGYVIKAVIKRYT